MSDFDDFDWVDDPSGREREKDGRSGVDRREDNDRYSEAGRRNAPARAGARPRPDGQDASSGRERPPRADDAHPYGRQYRGSPRPAARDSRDYDTFRDQGNGPADRKSAPRRPRPRRTFWSQIVASSRRLVRAIGNLPRPVLIGVGSLIFVVILTMVIDSALYYNKVHAGVSMAEQSLGGSTYDEAVTLIDARVQELNTQPITVASDSKTWTVTPEQVGQVVDVDASVDVAMQVTRKSNLISDLARRLNLYFSSDNLSLVGEVDQERFDAFVAQIAGEIDVEPVNQGLVVEGDTVQIVQATNGLVVDQDQLKSLLMDALFVADTTEIQVPMMTKAPEVAGADTSETADMVRAMASGEVTLNYLAPRPEDVPPPTTDEEQTAVPLEQGTTTTTIPETTTTTIVQTATGPLTFVDKTQTFTPNEIEELLDYRAEERNGVKALVPYISPDKLAPFFHRIEGPMTVPAENAYFASDDGSTCYIKEGQEGKGLDHEATAAALTEAALKTDGRVADALVKDIDPDFTREDAEAMGITTNLGSYETIYDCVPQRKWNVMLATRRASSLSVTVDQGDGNIANIDNWSITPHGNLLLAPGEEFSFAEIVGPRTAQAGFLGAIGIQDGVYVDGILGGGICQVSTTLFNAALKAGLKITERHNHSLFISHYEEGRDATVTGGGDPKDLRFVNDTPNYIWIYGWSNGIRTGFSIFGTSDGRRVAEINVSDRYNVTPMPVETSTTFDPELEVTETSIAFPGQDTFELTLTRVIEWPDGHTTSEEWYSDWEAMPQVIALPTSSTLPDGSMTSTTAAGP